MLTRWPAFARFRDDCGICLTNNAAERVLRGLALGRKSWLFNGSEREAEVQTGWDQSRHSATCDLPARRRWIRLLAWSFFPSVDRVDCDRQHLVEFDGPP